MREFRGQQRRGPSDLMGTFFEEAEVVCRNNPGFEHTLAALKTIAATEETVGLIGRLVKVSGQSRSRVLEFLGMIRKRSDLFTGPD